MKNYLFVVSFILIVFNCYSIFAQQKSKYELELNQFEKELEHKKITPTYRIQVENKEIRFEDFFINFSELDESLKIYINKDTLNVYKLITQNIVEDEKQQVDYANSLLEVNYYQELNIFSSLLPMHGAWL